MCVQVKAKIEEYNKFGYDKLPLCMAKTAGSLTGDANIKGAPTGFTLNITDIFVSVGAGFVVPMVGSVSSNSQLRYSHHILHF
jgi:methylenetetrahydrofolate dehydrogenase (NADP+)/methenyltetrahydrofolate cyclohydrolase/formyltetrahydrofolate synthetase